jgi:hypothetical protein
VLRKHGSVEVLADPPLVETVEEAFPDLLLAIWHTDTLLARDDNLARSSQRFQARTLSAGPVPLA